MRSINKHKFYRTLEFFERILLIIFLIHYAGAVVGVLTINGASEGDGIDLAQFDFSLSRNLYFVTYLFAGFGLIFQRQRALYLFKRNGFWLKGLLLTGVGSVLWTLTPASTNTAAIGLVGTAFLGLYIATRYNLEEQLDLVEQACKVIVILSIVFALFLPKYGLEHGVHAGAFRGVFTSKNVLGGFAVFSACVFLNQLTLAKRNPFISWIWISLSFFLIVFCQSTGALLNIFMVVFASFCVKQMLKLNVQAIIPLAILLIFSLFIFSVLSNQIAAAVLPALGKDPTLTGRSDIWAFTLEDILKRPLLGYGYNGYWENLEVQQSWLRRMQWAPPGPHNGFLAIAVDLGLIGLACFLLSMLEIVGSSFVMTRRRYIPTHVFWPFTYVIYLICTRFAEDGLFSHNTIFSLLFISMYFSILAESRIFQRQVKLKQAVA